MSIIYGKALEPMGSISESGGSADLILDTPPTASTVGEQGQHAICGHSIYYCAGNMSNGETTQYVWIQVNSFNMTPSVVQFTKSTTFNIADYGLNIGDTIIVACVSGGNGGARGVRGDGSSSNNQVTAGSGGAAGKGGGVYKTSDRGSAGGGGAGAGYGAGGGGGGGYTYHVGYPTGGAGGTGGRCILRDIRILDSSIPITIGAAGGSGATGGSTSFGDYITAAGGGGSAGGAGGSYTLVGNMYESGSFYIGGGGGGGGGGWVYVNGATKLKQYSAGSAGSQGSGSDQYSSYGGAGGAGGGGTSNGAGKGGSYSQKGGDTTIGAGSGLVVIWY